MHHAHRLLARADLIRRRRPPRLVVADVVVAVAVEAGALGRLHPPVVAKGAQRRVVLVAAELVRRR